MKCLGITTAKDTSNLDTDLLVSDNGNWLWELSNQIIQAILRHYYHCMHILISGRSRLEKMMDPARTASAPNESSNSLAHSTVANS